MAFPFFMPVQGADIADLWRRLPAVRERKAKDPTESGFSRKETLLHVGPAPGRGGLGLKESLRLGRCNVQSDPVARSMEHRPETEFGGLKLLEQLPRFLERSERGIRLAKPVVGHREEKKIDSSHAIATWERVRFVKVSDGEVEFTGSVLGNR